MRCHDEVSIFCRERFYLKWKFTVLQTFFAGSRTQSKYSTIFSGDTNNKDDGGNDSNTMIVMIIIFYLLLCGRTVKQILSGLAWYVRHATHKMLLFHIFSTNIIINKTRRNIMTIRVFAGTVSQISRWSSVSNRFKQRLVKSMQQQLQFAIICVHMYIINSHWPTLPSNHVEEEEYVRIH